MKTYQVRTYFIDGEKFDNDSAQLADIIEFTLADPPPGDNVFQVLKQWKKESGQDGGAGGGE